MRAIRAGSRPLVLRGLMPWTIAAIIVLGVGIAGLAFADRLSRQVDVTVETADGHGQCRVSWTDPWSHQVRHGPFDCPLNGWDRPLQPGDVTTESVADWPWRGQLYDEDTAGGPGLEVAAWVAVSGAVMLVGVAGVAVFRRIGGRFVRAQADAGTQGLPEALVEPSYANLATAAEAQWAYAGWDAAKLPRDRDVRDVPWWRVRALRAALGPMSMSAVLFAASVCTGPGALVRGSTVHRVWSVGLTTMLAAVAVYLAYEARWTAVQLSRAARSPFADTRRYVAVWESRSGSLWLMLFPQDCGKGDIPQAVIPLWSGRAARRRYGFPAMPVGDIELHSDPGRQEVVVPWSEGRPVWPRGPLLTVEPDNPEIVKFLRHFTSPASGPGGKRRRWGALAPRRSTRHPARTSHAESHRH